MISVIIFIERIVDLLFYPFESLHPMWAMTLVSVVVGVIALVIYKYTSNQDGIKDAKERIKGHFYELWIYIDELTILVTAQGGIIKNATRYLGYAMVPLAIMLLPIFVLFANMEERYHFRALEPGEETLIKLRLSDNFADWKDKVSLDLPQGLSLAAPPVRFVREIKDGRKVTDREYEANWKIRADAEGDYKLVFKVDGANITRSLLVGGKPTRLSPFTTTDLGTAILYPPTEKIPAAAKVQFIEVRYPEADFPFFTWYTWWVWPFLVISIIAAFFLKGPLKVEI